MGITTVKPIAYAGGAGSLVPAGLGGEALGGRVDGAGVVEGGRGSEAGDETREEGEVGCGVLASIGEASNGGDVD
jgi:hypothetical protein